MKREPPPVSLEIDKYNLDEEWRYQAEFYDYWAMKLEEVKDTLRRAENRLELDKAQMRVDILKNPEAYDLPVKPTKDAIDSVIILNSSIQESQEAIFVLMKKEGVFGKHLASVDQKKRGLENEVQLLLAGYYQRNEPKAKTDEAREYIAQKKMDKAFKSKK